MGTEMGLDKAAHLRARKILDFTPDRAPSVKAACACARTALRFVPEGEERPRLAIVAAEAWAENPTSDDLLDAALAASHAAGVFACGVPQGVGEDAAAYAAYATNLIMFDPTEAPTLTINAIVEARAHAADLVRHAHDSGVRAAYEALRYDTKREMDEIVRRYTINA